MRGSPKIPLAALASLAMLAALAGCGGAGEGPAAAGLKPSESSWVPGQPSLATFQAWAAITGRAAGLAEVREEARLRLLAAIEKARREARKHASDAARRAYLLARARAIAKYKAALRKAAREQREREERLRKRLELLEKLRRAREERLKVKPGEECELPEIKREFECLAGRLPDQPAPKVKRQR